MEKPFKNNVSKIYCERCDLIFNSRQKFEKHFATHSLKVTCDVCPIDTAIARFTNLFKRKSSHNLE